MTAAHLVHLIGNLLILEVIKYRRYSHLPPYVFALCLRREFKHLSQKTKETSAAIEEGRLVIKGENSERKREDTMK